MRDSFQYPRRGLSITEARDNCNEVSETRQAKLS